ncbi:L10-interacting MYB domain-containing protein-like [Prunus yedoensis var. nudiflora]|uniref:L10-interacting MYB domain-containing protein-like n=1 Tax=Prunus yedoensis var. nudiflora TaxID=2094558 RepID=A0A315AAI9_PRUYE|nr:L10-interacting MYB domain-containing protein-like [Prunus yedoensis var. nudiflora]
MSGKGKEKCATATAPERRPKKWDKMESYLDVYNEIMSQKLQREKEKSLKASSTFKGIKMLEKIVLIEWRKIFVTMPAARRRAWLASL